MAETTIFPLKGHDLPNSRALREGHRLISFRITDNSGINGLQDYRMFLMPEVYQVDLPQRITVTQTRGGAFVDNFGQGIGTLTISGTTGYQQSLNYNKEVQPLRLVDGFERWRGLRDHFQRFFDKKATDTEDKWQFHFLNWLQEEWYNVMPVGLPRLTRNVQQPLLFRYEITLQILGRVNLEGYKRPWLSDDDLAELATKVQRAMAIQARMEQLIEELYVTQVAGVDVDELDAITEAQALLGPSVAQMDAYSDQFIGDLLKRSGAPTFVAPTDSPLGITARTRAMAQDIRNFADGKTQFVNSTLQEANALVSGWRSVLDATDYALNLPGGYARRAREIMCAAQSLLLYPQIFRNTITGTLQDVLSLLTDSGCATTLRI